MKSRKRRLRLSKSGAQPRAWISEALHIYMTLTNLRGGAVPNSVRRWKLSYDFPRRPSSLCPQGVGNLVYKRTRDESWRQHGSRRPALDKRQNGRTTPYAPLLPRPFLLGLAPRLIEAKLSTDNRENEYDNRLFPMEDIVDDPKIKPNRLVPRRDTHILPNIALHERRHAALSACILLQVPIEHDSVVRSARNPHPLMRAVIF
jgi:hypothetical protein